jgi:hypothetical protein
LYSIPNKTTTIVPFGKYMSLNLIGEFRKFANVGEFDWLKIGAEDRVKIEVKTQIQRQ